MIKFHLPVKRCDEAIDKTAGMIWKIEIKVLKHQVIDIPICNYRKYLTMKKYFITDVEMIIYLFIFPISYSRYINEE